MSVLATMSHAEQVLDAHGQYLFGDWQGKRTELAQKGIKFEANALTDTNYLADGGHNTGRSLTTASQFWLDTQFDLEKLAGWEGFIVRFVATWWIMPWSWGLEAALFSKWIAIKVQRFDSRFALLALNARHFICYRS